MLYILLSKSLLHGEFQVDVYVAVAQTWRSWSLGRADGLTLSFKTEFYERFQGRSDLLAYAEAKNIPVTQTKAKPWSTDENLYHISYEAGILEDPAHTPPKDMWKLTTDPEDAPNVSERIVGASVIIHARNDLYQSIRHNPAHRLFSTLHRLLHLKMANQWKSKILPTKKLVRSCISPRNAQWNYFLTKLLIPPPRE